ncbi:hypothetical protein EON77_02570 [bacterium]|nr:MAG: hypothetical protein EON77_02570 [bacterium]
MSSPARTGCAAETTNDKKATEMVWPRGSRPGSPNAPSCSSTTAPFELVPARFTLTELQRVHEAVLGRALDKRNFRARILGREVVEPASAELRTGRHRPAQLYRWKRMTKKKK